VDKLLHRKGSNALPSHDNLEELVERFSNFFCDKIAQIRADLDSQTCVAAPPEYTQPSEVKFSEFTPVTTEDVKKIIRDMPKKSCSLDPIPTWLLIDCLDEIAPVISNIINLSLSSGEFPSSLKLALVRPLIKKILLALDILKNYRPVSNLPFLSKVTEKIASNQICEYTSSNDLEEELQSAYKTCHSTESALLKVHNDIIRHIDSRNGVVLVLLDLSAAFDTIDHHILLGRLSRDFGIEGLALSWLNSYLHDRHQAVHINGTTSEPKSLIFGVPQGSIIGPKAFTRYTGPIAEIARRHGLQVHLYADDTQLYASFDLTDPTSLDKVLGQISKCINEIQRWMKFNKLKLNDDKTELIIMHAPTQAKHITLKDLTIGEHSIKPSNSARNLGVIFDKSLNMKDHIKKVCQAANFSLRSIRSIRHVLSTESTERLMHAFITSKLDYCNSVLYGLPKTDIEKLQRIQNSAARLVTKTRKWEHIRPILKSLHWLPISERIEYKLCLLVYKALNGKAPSYIADLLVPHKSSRLLRSTSKKLLEVPCTRTKTYGNRAFSVAGPTLWNSLPDSLRQPLSMDSFKNGLKTYLFEKAFAV
jgi:hypothetical protein